MTTLRIDVSDAGGETVWTGRFEFTWARGDSLTVTMPEILPLEPGWSVTLTPDAP